MRGGHDDKRVVARDGLALEEDRAFVRDALATGAKGYVQKQAAGRELVRAIRAAAAGSG